MIAHAAPPPPVVAAPAVSFGRIAVRLGPGTSRVEVQADGRITHRRRVPAGPRRMSVPVPAGARAVRVRATGRGGSRWSATVRVRVLPPSARRAGRVPGFVDRRLQRDVDGLVARLPAIAGVYAQHLVTGCGAARNADARFPAASTLKAAILVDAVRRGRARELRGLLDRMVIDSDDRAANRVLAALGGGSGEAGAAGVTDTLRRLGLGRSLVRRPYIVEDARHPLPVTVEAAPALLTNFVTTPYELARLMVAVHRGAVGRGGVARLGIGAAAARAELLARLLDVRDATKLRAGLPDAVPVAHKSGYTREVKHDGGIVYLRSGPVAVAVMTWSARGVTDAAGDGLIAEVARAARHRLGPGGRCDGLPLARPRGR
ncbi:serine hydrolase [Miltoncostaea marina]|uniref:serine hydrolase n=1 Tax=Miltoncostaea marina TaxID=2843215 RepID=UPI001C3E32DD|nr:serine hydrolase [Miltoncostaea marina]